MVFQISEFKYVPHYALFVLEFEVADCYYEEISTGFLPQTSEFYLIYIEMERKKNIVCSHYQYSPVPLIFHLYTWMDRQCGQDNSFKLIKSVLSRVRHAAYTSWFWLLRLRIKFLSVKIKRKAIEQYFALVLFIMLYKVPLNMSTSATWRSSISMRHFGRK